MRRIDVATDRIRSLAAACAWLEGDLVRRREDLERDAPSAHYGAGSLSGEAWAYRTVAAELRRILRELEEVRHG